MDLFDPKEARPRSLAKASSTDREHRYVEGPTRDPARERAELDARVAAAMAAREREIALMAEEDRKRELIKMHRRGEYRLTKTQRAYQRRKKNNYRRRVRERRRHTP